tara:strand:+ start:120 stop:296 length:177 start_codon:yes stop_codon:yes gene_type:complete
MTKEEQKRLIIQAAEELESFIQAANMDIKNGISCTDLDDPDYYDYQTCYELMKLANSL